MQATTTLAELFPMNPDAPSAAGTSLGDLLLRERRDDGAPDLRESWLRWPTIDSFFPFRLLETLPLKERVGDHGHERVPVQALP